MDTLRKVALALVIIGAINWGLIGLFQFDLVASIFGGQDAMLSRLIYVLVGLSGLICLSYYFSNIPEMDDVDNTSDIHQKHVKYGTEFAEDKDDDLF